MLQSLQLAVMAPELTLAIGAMVLLMLGVATRKEHGELLLWLGVLILVAAGVLVATGHGTTPLFGGSFIVDPFARAMKLLTLTGAAVALLMSYDYWREQGRIKFEFPVLVLLATTGMLMMISAHDLIALYVGLELQSLALYVVAAFDRDSARSSEAGLKYFVLGALSSGMLLYGASLVYGFTGATEFGRIAAIVHDSGATLGLIFGLVFLMAGFAFKISAVPFHMWTPDVYEGAPTPVTAFFAAAPKLAAMALTVRTLFAAFPAIAPEWQQIVTFLAIASMALGAFAAIGQKNIKRLMAYSSISHMGYALVGLAAGSAEGVQGVIIYLAIYLAMTLGTFACILAMRRSGRMVEDIDQLAGLSRTSPLMAFMLAMLLFSLAGIPPLAGFFAKFYVFLAAIHAGLYGLAITGVLLSVVGAYYYLRIVKLMYFDAPAERFEPMPGTLAAVLGVTGAFTLLFFVAPAPLVTIADTAARSLF
jgi:NADH-quinone oxidoreductase subunit N